MRKFLSITLIVSFYQFSAYTQTANAVWIDSLKKKLPYLSDSAKVDCLNNLADAFRTNGPYFAPDSIYKYSIAANREALRIGYKKGEAFSLLNLGTNGINKAISIGEILNNPKILGRAYLDSSYRASGNDSYKEVLLKALRYFEQANDIEGELEANIRLCNAYTSSGKYAEGFKYCDKCIQFKKHSMLTPWGHEMVLWYFQNMAALYERAGDYEASLDYCRQGNQYATNHKLTWNLDFEIVNVLTELGKYDSALSYLNNFERTANTYVLESRPYWSTSLGQVYVKSKQYDKALAISKEGITYFKRRQSTSFALAKHLLCAASAYYELKNYKPALEYAKEGIVLAEKNHLLESLMEGYKLISGIYHRLGNNLNAYLSIQKYLVLKDSILNSQFYFRIINYKKQIEEEKRTSQINLLNKDNQLKEQKLKQESTLKKGLIGGLILLLLLAIFVFRTLLLKRKNEKLKMQKDFELHQVENEKKQAELEMQALRAQMNPHFIFNCLSSINRFILKNESKIASNYLTRFSRLMRMVLNNSQKPLISLDDELEMLELYLEMERLRFQNSFDYGITFLNTVDSDNIFIPPLLIQPFCENAIWHGLMNKEGQGRLDIELSMQNNILNCVIRDNGVGREKAEKLKSKTAEKEKSMGLKITTERLALLNREKGLQTFYEIEDLKDENENALGTKVDLKISFKNSIEEFA